MSILTSSLTSCLFSTPTLYISLHSFYSSLFLTVAIFSHALFLTFLKSFSLAFALLLHVPNCVCVHCVFHSFFSCLIIFFHFRILYSFFPQAVKHKKVLIISFVLFFKTLFLQGREGVGIFFQWFMNSLSSSKLIFSS